MRNNISICLLLLGTLCAPSMAATFSWAPIYNAGNDPDPLTGLGSVAYEFQMSRFEVTNAQYAEFLNGVDPTGANSLELYDADMAGNFGGIVNSGGVNGSHYVLKAGKELEPISNVTWFDAVRFTNWVNNGQGNSSTETGAYTLLGNSPTPSNASSITRELDAKFWLPNDDEWYKAAYHDSFFGTAGVYSLYADAFIITPDSDNPDDNAWAFNFYDDDGIANGINDGFAVTGSNFPIDPITGEGPFTDVGAYPISWSQYFTFDQNGNVSEWTESLANPTSRTLRGGSWFDPIIALQSTSSNPANPATTSGFVGFRIATVIPEPSSMFLGLLASFGLLVKGRQLS